LEIVRRILARVQKYLGGMASSQKLLIASLCVILVMTLFLVGQYAGKPDMVPLLPGASAEDQAKAYELVKTRFTVTNSGQLLVSRPQQQAALAAVTEGGAAPANSPIVFENILKTQSWINSRETNRQIYKVMLDNYLSEILAKFSGIKAAKVFVDAPEVQGFGASVRKPKASVALWSHDGKMLPQSTVDAAAQLVAGSVAGLDLASITVNDAAVSRPRTVTTGDESSPTVYREYQSAVEKNYKEKIQRLLSAIDGVLVEVTADVDVSKVRAQVNRNLPVNEGTVSVVSQESSTTSTDAAGSSGAEAGVRSNQQASINTGDGSKGGGRSEQKTDETKYQNAIGSRSEVIDDPRGMPTRLVATVALPRGYILGLIQQEKKAAAPPAPAGGGNGASPSAAETPPTPAEIDTRFQDERKRIHDSLLPHMQTRGAEGQVAQGEVVVTMMAADPVGVDGGGGGTRGIGGASGAGGLGSLGTILSLGGAGGGIIDKAVLGLLAVVALGMMALMVRKAGKHIAPPKPEELAGAPPTLETKSDVVGEADETETAMTGILVGDEELKATKLKEQVSELIQKSPDTAVKVLNRWVSVEQ
jgi:flagellar biosynthesis/type III secretory pathway M-ring protein FliF/YscJ